MLTEEQIQQVIKLRQISKMSVPLKPEHLKLLYDNGLIPKKKLKDRTYYLGHCRNSSVALWCKKSQKFFYVRWKFVSSFIDDIFHPEDDDGFDLFLPIKKIDEKDLKEDQLISEISLKNARKYI